MPPPCAPEGQFVFECGGHGCGARIHAALAREFEAHGLAYELPFYFPTIGEYAPLVEAAGMRVTHALLFDRPTALKGPNGMADWIRMFVQRPFEGMAPGLADGVDCGGRGIARRRAPAGRHLVRGLRAPPHARRQGSIAFRLRFNLSLC